MFVATNRFHVIPEEAAAFEAAWIERETHLHELDGFLRFHLLRGPLVDGHVLYTSWTLWASRAHFDAWTRSEQFRRAHAGAGATRRMTRNHPQFEGFEVLQTISGPRQAPQTGTAP